MSALNLKANWNIAKGWLEQKVGQWMKDDQQFTKGKEDELTGRILKRSAHPEKDCSSEDSCCSCHH